MLFGIPKSARCVQRFDDSLNSAIHITYRISLRSSSMREPRDPLLKVVLSFIGVKALVIHSATCYIVYAKTHSQRSENATQESQALRRAIPLVAFNLPKLQKGAQVDG